MKTVRFQWIDYIPPHILGRYFWYLRGVDTVQGPVPKCHHRCGANSKLTDTLSPWVDSGS